MSTAGATRGTVVLFLAASLLLATGPAPAFDDDKFDAGRLETLESKPDGFRDGDDARPGPGSAVTSRDVFRALRDDCFTDRAEDLLGRMTLGGRDYEVAYRAVVDARRVADLNHELVHGRKYPLGGGMHELLDYFVWAEALSTELVQRTERTETCDLFRGIAETQRSELPRLRRTIDDLRRRIAATAPPVYAPPTGGGSAGVSNPRRGGRQCPPGLKLDLTGTYCCRPEDMDLLGQLCVRNPQ